MSTHDSHDDHPEPAVPDEVLTGESGEVPSLGGALAGLGGLDLDALLSAAGEVQHQLAEAQEQAAAEEYEGVAGGGVVRITVTGAGEFRAVRIAPEAVDPADVEMLCDLILAALHDATTKAKAGQAGSLGDLGGLGDLLGGGGLGGLLGGEPEA